VKGQRGRGGGTRKESEVGIVLEAEKDGDNERVSQGDEKRENYEKKYTTLHNL